ncbi:GerMN domain-containing protein [Alteribacillus sp. HJP-4]|uniref:GerMN domain-containing protein n=1 Tax=Alteribacillus sp. HJP-4 TaxID=2775394 RepID=UPI0035CCDE5C
METKKMFGAAAFLLVPLILHGCGFGGSDEAAEESEASLTEFTEEELMEEFDHEADESGEAKPSEEKDDSKDKAKEEQEETVKRELYLLDENGKVVPQTFDLPKTDSVLKQSLEYLVTDGPVSPFLPNGFQAVLPPETAVDVHLEENGTAIADFSTEFESYNPENELAILQAVTWTLTQFENVDEVKFRINGYDQEMMPAEKTPIGEGFSRENGINLEAGSVSDMTSSESVTVYFLSQQGDNPYFVPVTRRVESQGEEDMLKTAIEELTKGPSSESELFNAVRDGTELAADPVIKKNVVSLTFNESLLSEEGGKGTAAEALEAIALTATEIEGIGQVDLNVEGAGDENAEAAEVIAEPISRPDFINEAEL